MTHLEWVIVCVGAAIAFCIIVAASENEKRLNRIIQLLIVANRQRDGDYDR